LPFGEGLVHVIFPLFDTLKSGVTNQVPLFDTVLDTAVRCQHRAHHIIATTRTMVARLQRNKIGHRFRNGDQAWCPCAYDFRLTGGVHQI
jgi:hypothetical protein